MSTVTVDTLSEFAGLSRRGLYRTLEASHGIKPGDLIRNVKRKHIKQLQDENPDLSPEEIAAKVGYSLIHLSRLMERYIKNIPISKFYFRVFFQFTIYTAQYHMA